MPVPNTSCQKRLTVTRAVSGFSGSMSHFARPKRLRGKSLGNGGKLSGVAGCTWSRRLSYSPRNRMKAIGGSAFSCITCAIVPRLINWSNSVLVAFLAKHGLLISLVEARQILIV